MHGLTGKVEGVADRLAASKLGDEILGRACGVEGSTRRRNSSFPTSSPAMDELELVEAAQSLADGAGSTEDLYTQSEVPHAVLMLARPAIPGALRQSIQCLPPTIYNVSWKKIFVFLSKQSLQKMNRRNPTFSIHFSSGWRTCASL